jgi:hypothetical protein
MRKPPVDPVNCPDPSGGRSDPVSSAIGAKTPSCKSAVIVSVFFAVL